MGLPDAMENPELSVVVAVAEGDPALTRCLEALVAQQAAPPIEIIVPYDDAIPDVARLAEAFPQVRFIDMGARAAASSRDASAALERIDRRRSCGLRAARGRLVGLLVDRGRPRPDWARLMLELHDREPYAAVGGAIENGADGALRRAVFLCDFGRFQSPLDGLDPEYVSDVNVCYDRQALERTRAIWVPRYREAAVHWAMRRSGERLVLSDGPTVVHRRARIEPIALIRERVLWGRNFGRVRGAESPSWLCALRAATTPLLPIVLLIRQLRAQLQKKRADSHFFAAIPALIVLLCFWSLGEFVGYCESCLSREASDPGSGAHT